MPYLLRRVRIDGNVPYVATGHILPLWQKERTCQVDAAVCYGLDTCVRTPYTWPCTRMSHLRMHHKLIGLLHDNTGIGSVVGIDKLRVAKERLTQFNIRVVGISA
jgi:hypothetical protein